MTLGYVTTLRSIMMLWLSTLPLCLIGEFGWLATPLIAFIAFLFINIEQMAVEIEQPFGDDPNDLPQEQYIIELEEQLLEMVPGFEPELEDDGGYALNVPRAPPPGGSYYGGGGANPNLGSFIAKYRMTAEMSEELLNLMHGGSPVKMGGGGAPPPEWNNVSPSWSQARRQATNKPYQV